MSKISAAAAGAPLQTTMEEGGADGESCFAHCDLDQILLLLALGHCSRHSQLAELPGEVIQHHLARHVRTLFMEDLGGRGLLTPVEAICATCLAPAAIMTAKPPAVARRVNVRVLRAPAPGVLGLASKGIASFAQLQRASVAFSDFADSSRIGCEGSPPGSRG